MIKLTVITLALLAALSVRADEGGMNVSDQAMYFSSPREAVEIISELLGAGRWEELGRYYDLSGTGIDIRELRSGEFFIRNERPETAHPGESWRYRQPFAPGFKYDYHTEQGDLVSVHISMSIDQGGGMTQVGMDSFMMRKTGEGYRIIPDELHIP